jgi:hypothetical protein
MQLYFNLTYKGVRGTFKMVPPQALEDVLLLLTQFLPLEQLSYVSVRQLQGLDLVGVLLRFIVVLTQILLMLLLAGAQAVVILLVVTVAVLTAGQVQKSLGGTHMAAVEVAKLPEVLQVQVIVDQAQQVHLDKEETLSITLQTVREVLDGLLEAGEDIKVETAGKVAAVVVTTAEAVVELLQAVQAGVVAPVL